MRGSERERDREIEREGERERERERERDIDSPVNSFAVRPIKQSRKQANKHILVKFANIIVAVLSRFWLKLRVLSYLDVNPGKKNNFYVYIYFCFFMLISFAKRIGQDNSVIKILSSFLIHNVGKLK